MEYNRNRHLENSPIPSIIYPSLEINTAVEPCEEEAAVLAKRNEVESSDPT